MKKAMQLFAAVGPLGAGKTTFVLNVIQALESRGFPTRDKVAYVVNDEGALIDGELARRSAEVVAMTNGCFTCSDTADLKDTLAKLEKSHITWVFLEGFGITAGNETRDFLESCPYPFHILCLLSQKHHRLDLVRYADVIKSQVRAATLAVGLTKHMHQIHTLLDWDESGGVLEFVAQENPGIPVVHIPNGPEIPDLILNLFEKGAKRRMGLSVSRTDHHHGHEHHAGCSCGHHHNHAHHEHHVHNMYPYFYDLGQETTLYDLRKAFAGKDFLLRIKGAIDGHLFNEVHGDWEQTVEDSRRFVTFYTSRKVDIKQDLPELATLVAMKKMPGEEGQGYQLLRKETATREETVEAIKAILAKIPHEAIVLPSSKGISIITHPEELQLVKEMSRRPYVIDEWFPRVLKHCMEYWVSCAEIVRNRKAEIVPHELATNQRELGVSMVWWTNRHGDFFGQGLVSTVERLKPGAMAAEGIHSLKSLNSDPERASWQCDEILEVLLYGIEHGDYPSHARRAAEHCLSLAYTPELRVKWQEALKRIRESETIAIKLMSRPCGND